MATENELSQALSSLGFLQAKNFYCGSWRGYAVMLWKYAGKNWFASYAVRLQKLGGVRKDVKKAVKELGGKPGNVQNCTATRAMFIVPLKGEESVHQSLRNNLDLYAAALQKAGIAPADTCAVSGMSAPDSLCLVQAKDGLSYQPVMASAVRQNNAQIQQITEENETNGSVVSGIVGAVVGMLVGVLINLLSIVFLDRVFALLFAVVPLASMFGYKLFKGKMNKAAIAVVLVLCLVAVLLVPYLEGVYYLVHDYGISLGEALPACVQIYVQNFSEFLQEIGQLLLFMALGVFIAWRYLSGQINSNQVKYAQTMLETLRPNPNHQPQYAPSGYESPQI